MNFSYKLPLFVKFLALSVFLFGGLKEPLFAQPFVAPSAGLSFSAIKSLSSEPALSSDFVWSPYINFSFGYKSKALSSALAGDITFLSTALKSDFYNLETAYISTAVYATNFFDLIIFDAFVFTSFGGFVSAKIYETKNYDAAYEEFFGYGRILKNYDAGLYTSVGMEYRNFILRVNSSLGLINLYIPRGGTPNLHSIMLSVALGYKFEIGNNQD